MEYYSQSGQDKWIYNLFKGKKDLFFLDVGAHDGIYLSNTLYLENNGWNGICIEASPKTFIDLNSNRKCRCINVAVSNYDGIATFEESDYMGNSKISDEGIDMPCLTLKTILNGKHTVIDYMSLDIEGSEFLALQQFPFDTHIIRALTVEHNLYVNGSQLKDGIFELLSKNGYIRVKEDVLVDGVSYPFEDWYIHKTMLIA